MWVNDKPVDSGHKDQLIDPHKDQLPVGLIAQLVEYCTGIAGVRVQVLFRPEFFWPFFCYSLSSIAKL